MHGTVQKSSVLLCDTGHLGHCNGWMFVQAIGLNRIIPVKPFSDHLPSRSVDVENLDELFSDTESDQDSDIYFDTESESSSESENEPVLEFIPGTMDQLIQDLTESVSRR
ncbi:hypothetical protein TNCV_2043691 [Trichonephila clavipes]|nr:hypothetical protein TNCV_2043691 [Trichonephila clavipes]